MLFSLFLPPLYARSFFRELVGKSIYPANEFRGELVARRAVATNPVGNASHAMFFNVPCIRILYDDGLSLPATTPARRAKRRALALSTCCFTFLAASCVVYVVAMSDVSARLFGLLGGFFSGLKRALAAVDWRANAAFRVTEAMRMSIAMSMILGLLLGVGVGLISGLEPAVVIGVSASMAMGCVFVMSFAILHGVNALRAVAFALFVSVCLPVGFGLGFGTGILIGVFLGLEDPDDIREKTADFVKNFGEFIKIVAAFTLEIL